MHHFSKEEKSMPIVWVADLNTGIDVIDEQHKRIVDYINQLEVAIAKGSRDVVGKVLEELIDYTLSHFAFEESLQEEAGYTFAKPHKAIHDTFVKRVAKYQTEHNAGGDVAKQTHDMLSAWLVHHIKREDMAYVSEVKASIDKIVSDKKAGGWLSRSLGKLFK
jgi:hemerythrin